MTTLNQYQQLVDELKGTEQYQNNPVVQSLTDAQTKQILQLVALPNADDSETQIRAILNDLQYRIAHVLSPQITSIQDDLSRDYQKCLGVLAQYHFLERKTFQNGDPERYFCIGDYNGSDPVYPEQDPIDLRRIHASAEDFTKEVFTAPTFSEIISSISQKQVTEYKKMKRSGAKPMLQLTPLPLQLSTLASNVNNFYAQDKIWLWNLQLDQMLLYEPQFFKTPNGQYVAQAGQTKSQFIREHDGWLVSIVPTREDRLKSELITPPDFSNLKHLEDQYLARDFIKKQSGCCGQGYEDYLISQLIAMEEGRILNKKTRTILTETALPIRNFITTGRYLDDLIHLAGHELTNTLPQPELRIRYSIRLKINRLTKPL